MRGRRWTHACMLAAGAVALAVGAGPGRAAPGSDGERAVAAGGKRSKRVRLPEPAGPFAPSHVRLVDGDPADAERLADVQACADCHPDVVSQWRSSAHANASFGNPYYRAVVDAFRRERGRRASRFCAGCHEPALLLSGAMDEPIRPADRRAHVGVTCLVCHGVREARPDGNGSYTLTTAPVPYPDPADPAQVTAHRNRLVSGVLRTGALCGSCHRSFLGPEMGNPHHLAGIDDLGAWRRSAWAGSRAARLDTPIPERDCRGCHMRPERATRGDMAADDGVVPSHRFAGAHSAMARELGDPAQQSAVRRVLGEAVTVDVAAIRHEDGQWSLPAERARVVPGEALELYAVVRNVGAGHRFPGGTRDLQHTWLELRVRDGTGRLIGRSDAGVDPGGPDGHAAPFSFRAVPVDGAGDPVRSHFVHRFRAVAMDTTVPPRDARAVRYSLRLPDGARGPLEITATVRHGRHDVPMQRLACRATRSARGRAFAEGARALGRTPIDGCAPQPITELARARIRTDTSPAAGRPVWRRLYALGLALSHGPQERIAEAHPALKAALRRLRREEGAARPRAMAMAALARVAARRNRRDEALEWLDRAQVLVGPHPALDRLRSRAHARVWRWDDAARAARRAARAAPRDHRAWAALARAAGSTRNDEHALAAAVRGLGLTPRGPSLLRSQAVASDVAAPLRATSAWDAFLAHRPPEDSALLRRRCARRHPTCNRDRQPVPTIRLATPR